MGPDRQERPQEAAARYRHRAQAKGGLHPPHLARLAEPPLVGSGAQAVSLSEAWGPERLSRARRRTFARLAHARRKTLNYSTNAELTSPRHCCIGLFPTAHRDEVRVSRALPSPRRQPARTMACGALEGAAAACYRRRRPSTSRTWARPIIRLLLYLRLRQAATQLP